MSALLGEDAHGEAGQLVELADQQAGEADEAHDLADGHLAAGGPASAPTAKMATTVMVAAVRVQDGEQAPPGQHGILRRQQLAA